MPMCSGIRVGVSINLFVKNKAYAPEAPKIFYYRTNDLWNRKQKFDFLDEHQHVENIAWETIHPNKQYTWLTEGLDPEFDTFIPIGTKEAKVTKSEITHVIFRTYCRGVVTNRDAWAYNFNKETLIENVQGMIGTYNAEVDRWNRRDNQRVKVNDFVMYDDTQIKWDRELRQHLQRGRPAPNMRNTKYAIHSTVPLQNPIYFLIGF